MNETDIKAVNELKVLANDMIQKVGSGNPGICMDMAAVMYTLFSRNIYVDVSNPNYFNRDRVVLSSGHIAPLYYAMLHMAGFNITKEDLMKFRRCGSNTPGMPELNNPIGVDASTGYAGDGIGIAVGYALGRRYIEQLLKQEDDKINLLDFTTYCFMSDADMMSGTSAEAFAFAGTQQLSNLVFLYDDNNMSGEGALDDVQRIDFTKEFQSLGFYVDTLKDASNIKEIGRAIEQAKNAKKPALLIFKNVIGKDTFNEGKNIVHDEPLTIDDTSALRRKYNIFLPPFEISKDSTLRVTALLGDRMKNRLKKWQDSYNRAKNINNTNTNTILDCLQNGKTAIPFIAANYKINVGYRESLIESNYKILNLISPKSNLFLGGSAEFSLASQTTIGGVGYQTAKNPLAKNIRFGARERAMSYILNGMSMLGLRVFGSTKLCFADEMKSGIRMTSIMNNPVTYIFTHDSIYNSEEGPSRIPIEEIGMLRAIPNLIVYRPADITELMGVWENIFRISKPSAIIISRNSIPKLPGSDASSVSKGAYIIKKEVQRCDGVLVCTGSEVVSGMQIAYDLGQQGLDLRVVSVPSIELLTSAGIEYQESIIPKGIKTIVIEASNDPYWYRLTSPENVLNVTDFAYSGIPIEVLQKMEYDYESLKVKVLSLLK